MKKISLILVLVAMVAPGIAFGQEKKKKDRPIAEQRAAKKKAREERKNGTATTVTTTTVTTTTTAPATQPQQTEIVMVKTLKTKKPRKETADLQDTYWRLTEMNGTPLASAANEAFIKLTEKKSVLEGSTGCNLISGSFQIGKRGELAFEYGTTKKMCGDMAVERFMNHTLTNTNRYDINGHHLLLYNDSILLAIFEAKYADE